MSLGVYLGWHSLAWEELRDLVRRAEELGYAAAFVDGDVSMLEERSEADCLDGWTATTALLAATSRIQVGSLRLVHHWNAAHLAQAVATAERLWPGRLRFQITIGDRPIDERFGLAGLAPGERIAWLDETLDATRALWRGETVTRSGRFVRLERARVRPVPPAGRIPITVAARRPGMLGIVAAHADVWEVNLPAIPGRVAAAAERLAEACARIDRDPAEIARSQLLFVRTDLAPEPALKEFRRLNPWFRSIPNDEARAALVLGDAAACCEQIAGLCERLGLALPIVDASGLPASRAAELLEALAPAARIRR